MQKPQPADIALGPKGMITIHWHYSDKAFTMKDSPQSPHFKARRPASSVRSTPYAIYIACIDLMQTVSSPRDVRQLASILDRFYSFAIASLHIFVVGISLRALPSFALDFHGIISLDHKTPHRPASTRNWPQRPQISQTRVKCRSLAPY